MSDDTTIKAWRQEELAKTGEAEGQCPRCGVFTTDGSLPVLHRLGCELPGLVQSTTFAYRLPV